MASPQKKPNADPRFLRESKLWLWAGLSFSLICGWMLTRPETKTTDDTSMKASVLDVVQNEVSQKSSRETTQVDRDRVRNENSLAMQLADTVETIQGEKDLAQREKMVVALVDRIALADIQRTLNELQRLGRDGLMGDISCRLLRRWAANDSHAAAAWAARLPESPMRNAALSGVALEWAHLGLKDAVAWAGQLPSAGERNSASFAIANEAVRSEPTEALSIAVDLPPSSQRDELLRHGAMEWASHDGASAANWAQQIQDVPLRDEVLAAVAASWSERDPLSAAKLAVGGISEGRTQSDAVIEIVQRWAQHDPESVAAWVKQFPSGNLKKTAIDNLTALGVSVQ